MMLTMTMMMTMMMMMMMKSDAQSGLPLTPAASAHVFPVSAVSGGAVLLTSDLREWIKSRGDVRWTHRHLLLSLKNNNTACDRGRCELQSDGSLRFSRVQAADAGNYSLEVFDKGGKRLLRKEFLLTVDDVSSISSSSSSSSSSISSVLLSVLVCCLLLLLIFITFFILRKRRSQRKSTEEENVYMAMHSHHGNKNKMEECNYVPCDPAVSVDTPITQQLSEDEENIYM